MTFIKPLPDSAPMLDTAPTMPAPAPIWKYPISTQPVISPPSIELRDWFAGLAMQGMLASGDQHDANTSSVLSEDAYKIADAMLKAREAK